MGALRRKEKINAQQKVVDSACRSHYEKHVLIKEMKNEMLSVVGKLNEKRGLISWQVDKQAVLGKNYFITDIKFLIKPISFIVAGEIGINMYS